MSADMWYGQMSSPSCLDVLADIKFGWESYGSLRISCMEGDSTTQRNIPTS